MKEKTLQQHIEEDKERLSDPNINAQSRRHYQEELDQLEIYQERHPEETKDPTSLELYCDSHPDASECRIYEN
jgi:hypothetical protein